MSEVAEGEGGEWYLLPVHISVPPGDKQHWVIILPFPMELSMQAKSTCLEIA